MSPALNYVPFWWLYISQLTCFRLLINSVILLNIYTFSWLIFMYQFKHLYIIGTVWEYWIQILYILYWILNPNFIHYLLNTESKFYTLIVEYVIKVLYWNVPVFKYWLIFVYFNVPFVVYLSQTCIYQCITFQILNPFLFINVPKKTRFSEYMLSLKECYLDKFMTSKLALADLLTDFLLSVNVNL